MKKLLTFLWSGLLVFNILGLFLKFTEKDEMGMIVFAFFVAWSGWNVRRSWNRCK